MTTEKQLKQKAIDLQFDKAMESLGFSLGPDAFWFYRWRGPILDIFDFWVSSSGKFVKVPILCCNEKIFTIDEDWQPDFSVFPKNFTENIALSSGCFINEEFGVEIGADLWSIKTDKAIEALFIELELLVKDSADPWFKKTVDDKTLFESFSIRCQESEFGQRAKKILVVEEK